LESGATTAAQLVFTTCSGGGGSYINNSTGPTTPTITSVQQQNNNGTNLATLAFTPTNVGDLLIFQLRNSNPGTSIATISGGGVTTWTKAVSGQPGSVEEEIWTGKITSAGSSSPINITYTATPGGVQDLVAQEFTSSVGAASVWSVDTTGIQHDASSGTPAFPTLVPSTAGELYWGYQNDANTGGAGSTSGFVYSTDSNGNEIGYNLSISGSVSPAATESPNGTVDTDAITVKVAGAGQSGNFNIQSSASGTVAGILQANASGSADILDLLNGNGVNVGSFGSAGSVALRTTTNSTTGFQIQNAAGSTMLDVDTTNSQVIIGNSGNTITESTTTGVTYAGTARHTVKIVLTPEYAGAVLDNGGSSTDIGTMVSGFDSTQRESYYQWSTAQSSNQQYDIVTQIPVPSNFSAWASTTPISVDIKTSDTTNGTVTASLYDTTGTVESSWNTCSLTPGTTSWTTKTGCTVAGTYTANGIITLRLILQSPPSGTTEVGNVVLSYLSAF
jgi:hypothetical protein